MQLGYTKHQNHLFRLKMNCEVLDLSECLPCLPYVRILTTCRDGKGAEKMRPWKYNLGWMVKKTSSHEIKFSFPHFSVQQLRATSFLHVTFAVLF